MKLKPDPWLADMFDVMYWRMYVLALDTINSPAVALDTITSQVVTKAITNGQRVWSESNVAIDEERFLRHVELRDTPWPVLLRPYLYGEPVTEEWVAAYMRLKLTS